MGCESHRGSQSGDAATPMCSVPLKIDATMKTKVVECQGKRDHVLAAEAAVENVSV